MFYVKDLSSNIVLYNDNKQIIIDTLKFMPRYQGLEILETKENETVIDFKLMSLEEAKAIEEQTEKERIGKLSLTKREVFLALYDDKKITPEQIRAKITDAKALIEFDFAEKYFRFNPLIDQIGVALGYTSEDLDYLFENNKFRSKEVK